MVKVLGGPAAVLTAPPVTGEHRPARERSMRTIRHANVPAEPDDRRCFHDDPLGVEDHSVGKDDFGLLLEDQHDGPARGNHRQWRVRRVEDERTSHGPSVTANIPLAATFP